MRFVRTALVAVLGAGFAATASASPITYTFSGILDPNSITCILCNGTDNTALGQQFSLVITSDTTAVADGGPGFFRVNNVNGAFTDGGFSATLTNVTIVVNSNTSGGGQEGVNFFNAAFNNGLGFDNNPALAGYQLATAIGPLTGTLGNLTPTNGVGNFSTTGTSFVHLEQNVDDSLTFTATTPSPVPEPATLTLLGLGLAVTARRRRQSR